MLKRVVLLVLAVALLAGCVQETKEPDSAGFWVLRAVDGDTIELAGGQFVRLLGINTPERGMPCYNEAKNLLPLLERFSKFSSRDFDLILVNNGSTDETEIILKNEIKKYMFARAVKIKKNIGYGHGIMTGLRASKAGVVAYTHADLQCNPADVFRAYDMYKKLGKNVLVKGVRVHRNILSAMLARGLDVVAFIIIGKRFYDINAQPKLFTRGFFRKMKSPPYDFSLDLYVFYLAKKSRMPILAIPVDFSKRIHGKSHWNIGVAGKWKFIKRNASYIWKLRGTNA